MFSLIIYPQPGKKQDSFFFSQKKIYISECDEIYPKIMENRRRVKIRIDVKEVVDHLTRNGRTGPKCSEEVLGLNL